MSWVVDYRRRPGEVDGDRECYGPDDEEAGYCMVMVDVGGRRVNWMQADPRRVQFSSEGLDPSLRPSCEVMGADRIREWEWKTMRNLDQRYLQKLRVGTELDTSSGVRLRG